MVKFLIQTVNLGNLDTKNSPLGGGCRSQTDGGGFQS